MHVNRRYYTISGEENGKGERIMQKAEVRHDMTEGRPGMANGKRGKKGEAGREMR